MGTSSGDKWCILRTAGQRTLPLARSLNEAGIEAWTPTDVVNVCKPRSSKKVDRQVAVTPTFVFVRSCHLHELMIIGSRPTSPHPAFSIFRWDGRIPLIADRDISALRDDEALRHDARELARRKAERRDFALGAAVTTDRPAFLGLTGIVQQCNGKSALVAFGGLLTVEIDTWQLEENQLRAA